MYGTNQELLKARGWVGWMVFPYLRGNVHHTKPSFSLLTKALHLVEQWGDGIIAAIQNEKQRRNLCPAEFKEFVLFTYHLLRMEEKSGLVKQLAASREDR